MRFHASEAVQQCTPRQVQLVSPTSPSSTTIYEPRPRQQISHLVTTQIAVLPLLQLKLAVPNSNSTSIQFSSIAMDPEVEYVGKENKYGVAKAESSHAETTPVETESTKTESRGLFGFGGKSDSSESDGGNLRPTETEVVTGEHAGAPVATTAVGTDYSMDSIRGGNPTGGTNYSGAALQGGNPTGGTDYTAASVLGGNPTGGTDFSGAFPLSTNATSTAPAAEI